MTRPFASCTLRGCCGVNGRRGRIGILSQEGATPTEEAWGFCTGGAVGFADWDATGNQAARTARNAIVSFTRFIAALLSRRRPQREARRFQSGLRYGFPA